MVPKFDCADCAVLPWKDMERKTGVKPMPSLAWRGEVWMMLLTTDMHRVVRVVLLTMFC
jgi:hypothetical protein